MNKSISIVTMLVLATAMATVMVAAVALPARAVTRFELMDQDNDGFLSAAELEAFFPGRGAEAFTAMDANGDGLLNHKEWMAGHYALGLGQGVGGQNKGHIQESGPRLILEGRKQGGQNQGSNPNQGILPY